MSHMLYSNPLLTRIYWPSFRRIVAGLFLLVVILWGPEIFGSFSRGGRLAPTLLGASGPVNVGVSMSFAPEEFNRERLSQDGIYAGMDGNTIMLYQVSPKSLEDLASIYWVSRIEPIGNDESE